MAVPLPYLNIAVGHTNNQIQIISPMATSAPPPEKSLYGPLKNKRVVQETRNAVSQNAASQMFDYTKLKKPAPPTSLAGRCVALTEMVQARHRLMNSSKEPSRRNQTKTIESASNASKASSQLVTPTNVSHAPTHDALDIFLKQNSKVPAKK